MLAINRGPPSRACDFATATAGKSSGQQELAQAAGDDGQAGKSDRGEVGGAAEEGRRDSAEHQSANDFDALVERGALETPCGTKVVENGNIGIIAKVAHSK